MSVPDRPLRRPARRRAGRVLRVLLLVLGVAAIAAAVFLATAYQRLSGLDLEPLLRLEEPLRVYAADGELMARFGTERRALVPVGAIPKQLTDAFVAAEDARFYSHHGVDARGLARAALVWLASGTPREGGSTITMQLARNLLEAREKTLARKLQEVLMAVRLERELSKEEIIGLYLNRIFFGHRAYGVAAAAALYYGRQLDELTLAQCAMLAAIPKAPSALNPITDPARALDRRDYVLGRMRSLGLIDEGAYRAALAEPDHARLHAAPVELSAGYAAEMVRREIVDRLGEAAYRRGLRVTTTIDPRLQRAAQRALRDALLAYDRRHGYRGPEARDPALARAAEPVLDARLARVVEVPELVPAVVLDASARSATLYLGGGKTAALGLPEIRWARPRLSVNRRGPVPARVDTVLQPGDLVRLRGKPAGGWELAQRPAVSGALVVIAPADGAVRALVGGYDFGISQFNRAVDARRQPGSAFKPFVFAAALEQGWTPASLVLDAPIELDLGGGRVWRPQNFDRRDLGPIRLRVALARSRNLATLDLLQRVGDRPVRRLARRLGFESDELPAGPTLALGAGAASPLRMAGAYAAFANGGYRVAPHLIARIEAPSADPALDLAMDAVPARAPVRVLEPRVAYQMDSMLRDVIESGTGRRAKRLGRTDLAGKTGTTNDIRDAWFCGYHPTLVAVAWMGFDDAEPLGRGETGGESALGLWSDFMAAALAGEPQVRRVRPPGLVHISIDPASGTPLPDGAPGAIGEWVREEYAASPEGPDPVWPDPWSGAAGSGGSSLIEEVY